MSLMAAATSWWSRQRRKTSSRGRRRWSIITTTPSSHATVGITPTSENRIVAQVPPPARDLFPPPMSRLQSCPAMIPVEEALEIVLREAQALPAEEVALDDALLRVLAEDVASDLDLPPFDRAAMDGYALRAADVAGAPVALEIVGEVRAGQWPDLAVGPGQAVRIMTGAPVPPGADAVQPVESTQPLDEFRVTIRSRGPRGRARGAPRLGGPRGDPPPLPRPGHRPRGRGGARLRREGPRARRPATRRRAPRHRRRDRRGVGHPRPRADPQQQRAGGGRPGAARRRHGAPARRRPRPAGRDRGGASRRALRRRARRLRRRLGRGLRPRRARPAGARGDVPLHEGGDQARRAPRLRAVAPGRSSSACPATPSPRR